MNSKRFAALVTYELVASRIHTRLPFGRSLRARLGNTVAESADRTSNIEPGVRLSRGVVVRAGAGIGAGTWFLGSGRVVLGARLKMGPQCMFITNDHPVPPDGVTFSEHGGSEMPIVVGDDVFLGARVTVLPGVTIGDGATVGAGSVVSRDVPAGAVAVGNPAKVVRVRAVGVGKTLSEDVTE